MDTLRKHELSVDHKYAVESRSLSESNTWQKSVTSSYAKAEESIVSAMKIVYLQAKEDLATKKFGALKDLCLDLGCSSLAGLNITSSCSYKSYDSIRDMEAALASVIQEEIVEKVKKARWFSIMIDECTDVSVEQSIIIYVKFVSKGKVFTHYLCLVETEGSSANELYTSVIKTLEKLDIDISKCSSLATDGPSVMTGIRAGVVALFKKRNAHLISVHCVAHRLALASSQAASEFSYLVKYQDILKRVHSYFENSPKNTKRLQQIQSLMEQTPKKVLKLSTTRWLSLGNSVSNMESNWSSIISVLIEDKRPVAQGLLKQISSFMFLATTALLNDVMFIINKLSVTFQKQNIDFELIQTCVKACIANLESMKNKTGTHLMDFLDKIPKTVTEHFEYDSHIVSDSTKHRENFENLMKNFLALIIANIQDRLGDLDKISIFNILLPTNLPNTLAELESYGKEEIIEISELLSANPKNIEFKSSELLSEWALFKQIMHKRLKKMNLQELLNFIFINEMNLEFPLMCSLVEYAITIPLHTTDCERGFSALNLIKRDIRNRINLSNVNNILMIKIEGPERNDFNFEKAFEKWANLKERKILNPKFSFQTK